MGPDVAFNPNEPKGGFWLLKQPLKYTIPFIELNQYTLYIYIVYDCIYNIYVSISLK